MNTDRGEAILGHKAKENSPGMMAQQDRGSWILDRVEYQTSFRGAAVKNKLLFWNWVMVAEITCLDLLKERKDNTPKTENPTVMVISCVNLTGPQGAHTRGQTLFWDI